MCSLVLVYIATLTKWLEGTKLLREYFDYAKNDSIALEQAIFVSSFKQFDSDFEFEVCDYLKSRGFAVDAAYARLIALCLLDEVSKRNITVGNLSIIRPKGKTDAPQIEEVFENVQYVKLEFIDYMYRDAKKRLIGYIRDHGLRQQDLEGCLGDLLDEEWYKINI